MTAQWSPTSTGGFGFGQGCRRVKKYETDKQGKSNKETKRKKKQTGQNIYNEKTKQNNTKQYKSV